MGPNAVIAVVDDDNGDTDTHPHMPSRALNPTADDNPYALVRFTAGGRETLSGELRQGGQLVVDYELGRLTGCRQRAGGLPCWDLIGFVSFSPGGQTHSQSLVRHVTEGPAGQRALDPSERVPLSVPVPPDAEEVRLWFLNRSADGSCQVWDSRYGDNYRWPVAAAGPQPAVPRRPGTQNRTDLIQVVSSAATKQNLLPGHESGGGKSLATFLTIQTRVANLAYAKDVEAHVHVFDEQGRVVASGRHPLRYLEKADGKSDLFGLDTCVYQGATATPGSAQPRPNARTLQYRLYYRASDAVYTDGVLHQHELRTDELTQ